MAYNYIGTFPPLTTTFTAPASCASAPWTYIEHLYSTKSGYPKSSSSQSITTLSLLNEYAGIQLPTSSMTASFDIDACLPSGYAVGYGHYSPGVCPDGQTTATKFVTSKTSVALCCPR
jgi:hypothetical protein